MSSIAQDQSAVRPNHGMFINRLQEFGFIRLVNTDEHTEFWTYHGKTEILTVPIQSDECNVSDIAIARSCKIIGLQRDLFWSVPIVAVDPALAILEYLGVAIPADQSLLQGY